MLDQKQIAMSSAKSLPHLLPVERWNSSGVISGRGRVVGMSAITFLAFIIYDWRGRSLPLPLLARLYGWRGRRRDDAETAVYSVTPSVVVRGRFMIQGMGMLPAEWRDGGGRRTAGRGRAGIL